MPHVESFSYMLNFGLADCVADLAAREVTVASGDRLQFWLEAVTVGHPLGGDGQALFPRECRERGGSYTAALRGRICRRVNGGAPDTIDVSLGELPMMVRSSHCSLRGFSPRQLVAAGEEASEFGGYFICNGIERIIRMLQIPKRNYPMAVTRSAYSNRGPLYSNKGVIMRCVRPDQSGVTLTLHYLVDGSATVRFAVRRQEFFLPVVMLLKALTPTTDREVFERVVAGETSNTFLSDRVLMLLREAKRFASALHSQAVALTYLGSRFRAVLDMPASLSDLEAGQTLLDRYVLVHVPSDRGREKFDVLVLMLRKLYAFVRGDVLEDNPDSLANQELLLSGHLIQMVLKEKLHEMLASVQAAIQQQDGIAQRAARSGRSAADAASAPVNVHDAAYFRKIVERQASVGRKVSYLLATGNLISSSGLDLMQTSGFTVVADKINFMRFTTHFRSVHRGQFFSEMKTTTVRKLLPENWGFLCPVHTPDGAPCGLLNHLAASCTVVAHPLSEVSFASVSRGVDPARKIDSSEVASPVDKRPLISVLSDLLVSLGMVPHAALGTVLPAAQVPVLFDGRVLGGALPHVAYNISKVLRQCKARTSLVYAQPLADLLSATAVAQGVAVRNLLRESLLGLTSAPSNANADRSLACFVPLPPSLEVAFIPPSWWDSAVDSIAGENADARCSQHHRLSGLFPGLFLQSTPARLIRPVLQLSSGLVELISPLEQPYLDIACTPDDIYDIAHQASDGTQKSSLYTHIELHATAMLSEAAALTPFSDLNQSPRNMYQCQMGKQTMGTPLHSFPHRPDSKLFRLQNPQAPLVQCRSQSEYGFDEYPSGCNAVVAVIAYTGYDMEDACIINKASYERGFGHASVYKTIVIDLQKDLPAGDVSRFAFNNVYVPGEPPIQEPRGYGSSKLPGLKCAGNVVEDFLDEDGLPAPGSLLKEGLPFYAVFDAVTRTHAVTRYKEIEPAYVDEVRMLSSTTGSAAVGCQRASIKLRFNRNPIVGDKFSSRHGQKGVLSYLWPPEDMPFSDAGMTPDVIINPHAFPSRMTIGMLVESMAGKAGACHATFQDSTPFRFCEGQRAVDFFGEQLASAGYNYYGTETMYSGVTGEALPCDIYLGVVYYQRLRHMVSDKAQVRSLGKVNNLTRQPVKGRKKHGGIRFGEMERDSLLAHGASFLLHDRLMNCSDRHLTFVCKGCGGLLPAISVPAVAMQLQYADALDGVAKASLRPVDAVIGGDTGRINRSQRAPLCRSCGTGEHCELVALPYVFRYLSNELAAMKVGVQLELESGPY